MSRTDVTTRPDPVGVARRVARLTVNRGVRYATAPVRTLARAGRDDTDPRWPNASWLWQPGWGRYRHDRLYRAANPYRGAFGQIGSADVVHDRLGDLADRGSVRRVRSERIDDIGPDGAGARFEVVSAVVPVPAQRRG